MFDWDITIDPVDRLSRAKRKRRAGAFLCSLTLLSLGLLSACNDLHPVFNTTLLKQHFNDHKAAFEAIESELLADENVIEVAACPPNQEDCFVSFEPPSDDQIIFNEKYQPLLQELGFPGPVFFTKSNRGFFDFPNMGHAYTNGYRISASFRLYPTQKREFQTCEEYAPSTFGYACEIAIDENWAIHWLGYNDRMINACSGQAAYDECDPETRANEDWACFEQCIDKLEAQIVAEEALSQPDQ